MELKTNISASKLLFVSLGISTERVKEIQQIAEEYMNKDHNNHTIAGLIGEVAKDLKSSEELAFFCYGLGVADAERQIKEKRLKEN